MVPNVVNRFRIYTLNVLMRQGQGEETSCQFQSCLYPNLMLAAFNAHLLVHACTVSCDFAFLSPGDLMLRLFQLLP